MSFSNNDKLTSALPEETWQGVHQLARQLNCSNEEVSQELMDSFLNLIENPESIELTGLAKELYEKHHFRKPYLR